MGGRHTPALVFRTARQLPLFLEENPWLRGLGSFQLQSPAEPVITADSSDCRTAGGGLAPAPPTQNTSRCLHTALVSCTRQLFVTDSLRQPL